MTHCKVYSKTPIIRNEGGTSFGQADFSDNPVAAAGTAVAVAVAIGAWTNF